MKTFEIQNIKDTRSGFGAGMEQQLIGDKIIGIMKQIFNNLIECVCGPIAIHKPVRVSIHGSGTDLSMDGNSCLLQIISYQMTGIKGMFPTLS